MADWNGFKKNGETYIPNDATARASISVIEGKIPVEASTSNQLVTEAGLNNVMRFKADLLDGKVPSSQLPSYVDDVLEYASQSAFPATGETGKIYIALDTNKTYRWSGSAYVEISESLALGETASSAYAGNKGKANADAIAAIKDGSSIDSFGDVEEALAEKVDKVQGKGLSTNDYNNTAKGIVDNIQSNVIANTKLIKDTVGWSGKNLLPNNVVEDTYADVVLTKNANGSFTLNGGPASGNTASMVMATLTLPAGKYILSKSGRNDGYFQVANEAQTQELYYAGTSDALIELSVATTMVFRFRILQGATFSNEVFYPMLRSANVLDPTYEPYFGSTAFPRSEQAVLGAKNLYPKEKTAGLGTTVVTQLATGVKVVNSAAGTYKASYCLFTDMNVTNGVQYTLEADVTVTSGKGLLAVRNQSDVVVVATEAITTNGHYSITFTMSSDYKYISLFSTVDTSEAGEVAYENLVLKLATDTDPTYAPYAMTNKELTENIEYKKGDVITLQGNTFGNGFISSGATEISVTLPLGKVVNGSVTTSGVTFGGVTFRGVAGYIGSTDMSLTALKITEVAFTSDKSALLMRMKKQDETAFDVTNNTVVTASFNGLTITVS